jgi:hypothetical protein
MATKEQLAAAREELINAEVEKRMNARMAQLGATASSTVKEHVASVQPQAASADIGSLFEDLPSPSRVVIGLILGLVTAGGVGYGVGTLMSFCLAGIATMTGSALLGFMLTALTWVVGIYAGWKLSTWAGSKVFSSIVMPEGLVSKCVASLSIGAAGVKDAVKESAAKTSIAQRAAAFTGAFTQPVQDVDVVRA